MGDDKRMRMRHKGRKESGSGGQRGDKKPDCCHSAGERWQLGQQHPAVTEPHWVRVEGAAKDGDRQKYD